MSYYKPSYNQSSNMQRGRGGGYTPRGSTFRGGGGRGSRGNFGSPRGFSSFDSRPKYSSSERYSAPRSTSKFDDYRKPFRNDSFSSRERSPERKKPKLEGYSSRHDTSYGSSSSYGGRYESPFPPQKRFSDDRSMSYPRRDDFRRPGPQISRGGGYRGRGSPRGSRIMRPRERMPPRRKMIESSYGIRKRIISSRALDYSRRLKLSKLRSEIASQEDDDKSEAEGSDEEQTMKKDSDKEDNEEESDSTKKQDEEDQEKTEEKTTTEEATRPKKVMIKLVCPHCNVRCITFRRYEMHLNSRNHLMSMKRVASKQKAVLSQMRQAQRAAQNELEKTSSEDLQGKTSFCPLCKLNYKQRKLVHQASEGHKNMKKFLMPTCKVCSVTFKSPMIYQNHCCSIEHMKRKQRMEHDDSEHSNVEGDLENFTTIDSVGDDEDADKKDENETKESVDVGVEKIRKVEAHYCDLCRTFLPVVEESEIPRIISKHCKVYVHLKRYVRYKEDKELEERAQRLQKKETAEKARKVKKEADEADSKPKEGEDVAKTAEEEENKDDKMWADVDKDLGDILADAEDDDEEETSAKTKERYDRFKLSEKNGEEVEKDGNEEVEENVSNGDAEEDAKEEN